MIKDRLLPLKQPVLHPLDPQTTLLMRRASRCAQRLGPGAWTLRLFGYTPANCGPSSWSSVRRVRAGPNATTINLPVP